MDYSRPHRGNSVYIDLRKRRLIAGRTAIFFSPHEWEILVILWREMPKTVKREILIEAIWGKSDSPRKTRTVDVHIASIRKKIAGLDIGSIDSIYGVGYRFIEGRRKMIFEDGNEI